MNDTADTIPGVGEGAPVRDVCGEEGGGGGEGCEEIEPGLGGEEMGRSVGVKSVVFVPDGVVGTLSGSLG